MNMEVYAEKICTRKFSGSIHHICFDYSKQFTLLIHERITCVTYMYMTETNAPIGAWKFIHPFKETMNTDRPNNRQTDLVI